jgi:RNA polymerase sigma-70 factor (ECF subfamily)
MSGRAQTALEISDEELVLRFQQTGQPEHFAALYERHKRKVWMSCRGFFGGAAAAEDATQDTFLRAFQSLRQFHEGSFSAWLMRIAKNICIDVWRKQHGETPLEEAAGAPAGSGRPMEELSGLRLAAQKVVRELEQLPVEQRECLRMKIEGYSYEETAARTGLTVAAVKSHLQNGRRMLWLRAGGALAGNK